MKPDTVDLGPMTCTIDDSSITCKQDALPEVNDERSFLSMLDTCYAIPSSSDEAVNEVACTSFTAKVYKKNFLKPPSFQNTSACKWIPGKPPRKGKPGKFGYCTGNREELQDLAFPVSME